MGAGGSAPSVGFGHRRPPENRLIRANSGRTAEFLVGPHGQPTAGTAGSSQACTSGTTDAPSPLAAATRFMDPALMSPAAKTPGTVLSRLAGGRSPDHRSGGTS